MRKSNSLPDTVIIFLSAGKSSRKPSSDPPDLISREVFPHRHGPGDVAAGSSVNTDVPPSLITASRMQTGAAGLTVHTPFVGGIGKEQRDIGALSYSTPAPSLFPTDTSGEERGRGRLLGEKGTCKEQVWVMLSVHPSFQVSSVHWMLT